MAQFRNQGEGQAEARLIPAQFHLDGMEPAYIAGGVLNGGVVGNSVRSAVWQRQKSIAAGVGDCRADAAEKIGGSAVFQFVLETGEICKRTGPGLIERSGCKQRNLCVCVSCGK